VNWKSVGITGFEKRCIATKMVINGGVMNIRFN